MECEGFNGRKRIKSSVELSPVACMEDNIYWCIANVQVYVDGGDDCFVKEVPVSVGSEYMTYEADHFLDEATLYGSKEMAERLIECYHMSDRVYKPMKVLVDKNFIIDPDNEYTEPAE